LTLRSSRIPSYYLLQGRLAVIQRALSNSVAAH
jgi:hypothetical protein